MTSEPRFTYLPPLVAEFCQCKVDPIKMMFCETGHMTECHFPLRCEAAACSHLERYDYPPEVVAKLRKANHATILEYADSSCLVCKGTGTRTIKADLSEIYGVTGPMVSTEVCEFIILCTCVGLNLGASIHPNSPIVTEKGAFIIGRLFITSGARAKWEARGDNWEREASILVARHWRCDWGDLDAIDRATNDKALEDGGRLLSMYQFAPDFRVYIITEAGRSSTTVLLPDEY